MVPKLDFNLKTPSLRPPLFLKLQAAFLETLLNEYLNPLLTSFFFFLKVFGGGPFLNSVLNLLQYCFCFKFWVLWQRCVGILLAQPGIKHARPALEGKVLTTGSPGKSLVHFLPSSVWSESAVTPTTLLTAKDLQCAWPSGGPSVLISPRLSVELRRWVPPSASRHLLLSQHLYPQAFLFLLPPSGPLLLSLLG